MNEDLGDIVAKVPAFAGRGEVEIAPLSGVQSLNNEIWIVTLPEPGERYVLRVASPIAHAHLGVRRDEEGACVRAAAGSGVGPELIFYDDTTGHMVTRWVAARPSWAAADFAERRNMSRLADLLRRMHQVPVAGPAGMAFRRVERLVESVRRLRLEAPAGLDGYLRRLGEIEAMRQADRSMGEGLNHNDLWANNMLDDGERLWLVDWEFSGPGDGYFDLATVSMAGGFGAAEDARLLGEYGAGAYETLQSAKWAVRLFEAAWSLVMHHQSMDRYDAAGKTFDFLGHSKAMFASLDG